MLDKGTFGGSLAAKRLNAILIDLKDAHISRFCARCVNQFYHNLKILRDIEDGPGRINLRYMIKKAIIQRVDSRTDIPVVVLSHLKNHLTSMFRRELQCDGEWLKTANGRAYLRSKQNEQSDSGGESNLEIPGTEGSEYEIGNSPTKE